MLSYHYLNIHDQIILTAWEPSQYKNGFPDMEDKPLVSLTYYMMRIIYRWGDIFILSPDSKVRGTNMGPIWGRQDPGGPHVAPMSFAIGARRPSDYQSTQ